MKKALVIVMLCFVIFCLTGCQQETTKEEQKKASYFSSLLIGCYPVSPTFISENSSDWDDNKTNLSVTVAFGKYEQDNNIDNGAEPIDWLILDEQEGKALLLSKYGLDSKPFDGKGYWDSSLSWENCTLREWLNKEFVNTAFSEEEKGAIVITNVNNDAQQGEKYHTSENDTKDAIFLLSYNEVFNTYLDAAVERICVPTEYAIANSTWDKEQCQVLSQYEEPVMGWYLRSISIKPFANYPSPSTVNEKGKDSHNTPSSSVCAVRPAIWVDLSKLQ